MNKIRLKVCGLRDNIEEVIALGPDYAGFIFYNKSPRYVGAEFEMPDLNDEVKSVGVFVNESLEHLQQLAVKHQLNYIQLHGIETPDYCGKLRQSGIRVIKAFQMDEKFDFGFLKDYESSTDYFLFDTKTSSYGGSGKAFNWDLLKKYEMDKQYFLSGGISLENIRDLIGLDVSKIHALDVNSKFEVNPGLKDVGRLQQLSNKLEEMNL